MRRTLAAAMVFVMLLVGSASAAEAPVDITHYDFDIALSPSEQLMEATVTLYLVALEDDVSSFTLLLNDLLQIEGLSDGSGREISFARDADVVTVTLPETLNEGDTIELTFVYSGRASLKPIFGSYVWGYIGDEGSYMIYEARWYPMIWGNRATAELRMKVPKGMSAITMGQLIDVVEGEDYTEFTWREDIPTRGISFTAGNYVKKSTTAFLDDVPTFTEASYDETLYLPGEGEVSSTGNAAGHPALKEVNCYLYPDDISAAQSCLDTSVEMIQFFSSTFGDYPYPAFTVVEIPDFFRGGHGDQAFIMLYADIFTKEASPEFLAHEIAHNWWGALVYAEGAPTTRGVEGVGVYSPRSPVKPGISRLTKVQGNSWLLEGFATYSSVLYIEHKYGAENMAETLEDMRREYLTRIKTMDDESISSVEEEYSGGLYHAVVYSKGAWVLHMLRHVVGEETFQRILQSYAVEYAGESAEIADFITVAEKVSGRDLTWFFTPWLMSTDIPDYAVGGVDVKREGEGYLAEVKVVQKGDIVAMPVEVTVDTGVSKVTKKVTLKGASEVVEFNLDSKPRSVELDRDKWILESDRSNNVYVVQGRLAKLKLFLKRLLGRI